MRLAQWTFACVAFVWLSGSQANAEATDPPQRFAERYGKLLQGGAWDDLDGMLSDSVEIFPEQGRARIGKLAAERYYATLLQQVDVIGYRRAMQERFDLGGQQLEIGDFELRLQRDGGAERTLPGTYFEIWDSPANGDWRLRIQAWNYAEALDDWQSLLRVDDGAGVHYAHQPILPVDGPIPYELAALHSFNAVQMLRGQHDLLSLAYAEDAINVPHDSPPVVGRPAIAEFFQGYSASWPPFHFVDVNPHWVHVHGHRVLELLSYQLRWQSGPHSGVGMGKGICLYQRGPDGTLQVYRNIAMHD